MQEFYDRHIRGVEPLPYSTAFAAVGLRLDPEAGFRIEALPAAPRDAHRRREDWLTGK